MLLPHKIFNKVATIVSLMLLLIVIGVVQEKFEDWSQSFYHAGAYDGHTGGGGCHFTHTCTYGGGLSPWVSWNGVPSQTVIGGIQYVSGSVSIVDAEELIFAYKEVGQFFDTPTISNASAGSVEGPNVILFGEPTMNDTVTFLWNIEDDLPPGESGSYELKVDVCGGGDCGSSRTSNAFNVTLGAANTAPAATTPSFSSQATNGSGHVTFTTQLSDADADETSLKVEFSEDGSTWRDAYLDSVTPSTGEVALDNAAGYQISGIDTDGANPTLTIVWDTKSASNGSGALTGDQSDIKVRVTPNDATTDGSVATSNTFTVDNEGPAQVANFQTGTATTSTMPLIWDAVVDDELTEYRVYYRTTTGVTSANGTAWNSDNDGGLLDTDTNNPDEETTITELDSGTTYYFVIYAYDSYGNVSAVSSEAVSATLTPGVTITETGGTAVTEGGATDTYTVVLDTQPTDNVTIDVAVNGTEVTVDKATLTFTNGDWNTPQTVTVTAVDDDIDEDNGETDTITHTLGASDDADYNTGNFVIDSVTATITDDDDAGVAIVESEASTDVTEVNPATTDTYTLVLESEPMANVTIDLSYDTEQLNVEEASATANDDTLVFTSANWDEPQTITVNALDDSIDDPATMAISHTLSADNADAKYDSDSAGFTIDDVTVNVTDNDTAGVTVTEVGGASTDVTEGGATDTFTVVLDTKPTDTVTVNLAAANNEINFSDDSLDFTTENWDDAQTVTVTAVDDSIDEDAETDTISYTVTSNDANYNALNLSASNITVNITDNDTASVSIVESGESTAATEGGTDTYTVVLGTEPTADVTITVTTNSDFSTDQDGNALTFTDENWDTPQTVTLTATDDSIDETSPEAVTVTHTATSADGKYNGITVDDVSFSITDNDTAGITVAEVGGASTDVTEGGATDTFTVVLDTQPLETVTIDLNAANDEISFSANSLTFTTENWDDLQTVTVTAVDDDVDEDAETDTVSYTVASNDDNYDEFNLSGSDITVNVTDDDTAAITVVEVDDNTAVTEGDATGDTFTVVLGTQPTDDVVVGVSAAEGLTVDESSLTFTAANWDDAQTVTVTGTDNNVDGENTTTADVSFSITSDDGKYNALDAPDNITVTITDDDTAGVTVTESGESTDVTEAGDTDIYTLVLDTQPTDSVSIAVAIAGDDATISTETLTFSTANWATPQAVTVAAIDDDLIEDAETAAITHTVSSDDAKYDDVATDGVTVNITSDDTASVTITESVGATSVTEGGTDTYTVVLTAAPTEDVVITISGDAVFEGQATIDAETLTFTSEDWAAVQTVTITATDDETEEETVTATLSHTVASEDANYDAAEVNDVSVTIIDNDAVEVEEEASGGGGGGGSLAGRTSGLSSPSPKSADPVTVNEGSVNESTTIVNDSGVEVGLDKGTEVTDEETGEKFAGEIKPPQVISGNDAPAGAPFGNKFTTVIRLETSTGGGVRFNQPVEVCVPKPANTGDRVEVWFFNAKLSKWTFFTNDVSENGNKLCFKTNHFSYFAFAEGTLDFGQETEFTDIEGHWAEEHIKYLESLGVIKAGPTKKFTPDRSINRGELVTMATNAFGFGYKGKVDNVFTDILSTSQYYKAIMATYERGIIQGYPDGTFQEYGPALRVEALKVLLLASNMDKGCPPVNRFADISSRAWYYPYVNCGVFHGIVKGYGDGTFLPARQVTKAEATKMLAEMLAN